MNNNVFGNGNNVMFGRVWSVELPDNGFVEGLKILFNRLHYSVSKTNNIYVINKNSIEKIGFTAQDDRIIIEKDVNLTKEQVLEGNYIFRTPLISSICIATSQDIIVMPLDLESMKKLSKKNLLPVDPYVDNMYIRLPNNNLDVYKHQYGRFIKLSDEAGKEIISLFNQQCDRINTEKDDE